MTRGAARGVERSLDVIEEGGGGARIAPGQASSSTQIFCAARCSTA